LVKRGCVDFVFQRERGGRQKKNRGEEEKKKKKHNCGGFGNSQID
jgi:hypothetical protein